MGLPQTDHVGQVALLAANFAHDLPYQVNAIEVMIAAAITFIHMLRQVVQRSCAARLWGGNLVWFVFWAGPHHLL